MAAVDDVGRGQEAAGLALRPPPAAGSRVTRRGRHRLRLPLVAMAMASLVLALAGGVARLGWPVPGLGPLGASVHGPLMVSGFLGTLIALERAVALGRWWAYGAPLMAGLGAAGLVLAPQSPVAGILSMVASIVVIAVFAAVLRMQPALHTGVMALGAGGWLVAQALWLAGWPVARVAWWWIGFLVLTIAGERLELSRLVRVAPAARALFAGIVGVLALALVLATLVPEIGSRATGVALIALAGWLTRHDLARRTVRQHGLPRFIACCILSGYAWLGVTGILSVVWGDPLAGPRYDAILHAVFLGFVFSMIFGHAPLIFPAVVGWAVGYRPVFYLPLGVLHLGLVARVLGDAIAWLPLRQWGGLVNALAVALFLACVAAAVLWPPRAGGA